ncbi:MAG: hypothetical protein M3R45_10960 [Pseudomonadota bacterium]|nr:hypothetical protein [Pseudomonadota bacterium]
MWQRALAVLGLVLSLLLWSIPAHAYDDEMTDYVTIPTGAYIVDMGASTQTVANGLRPYGLVYDLVKNQKVPVLWAINPAKVKDSTDFTYAGKSYQGGPFIIEAASITPAVLATINSWKSSGVLIDGPTTAPISSVPIYDAISGLSNVALDFTNGSIASVFLMRAGIPATAYSYKYPVDLNSCNDFFVMPHADPTWAVHGNLLNFVKEKGYIWSGCHAVSVLENLDNPATPTINPDLNFLTTNGLLPYRSHSGGSPPYLSSLAGEPVMQFLGTTDAAQLNGSEQIYLPSSTSSWRPGAKVLVYDTTQANIPLSSAGPAAAIVYGRAFDTSIYGRVMYEGGHDVGGTAPANIAAQRAFLNFLMLSMIDRSPDVTITASALSVNEGFPLTLSANVTHTTSVSYQWVSSGGGTFSAPNSATTTFTPPEVTANTTIQIRLLVSDNCGRTGFSVVKVDVINLAKSDLAIAKKDSADPVSNGANFSYTLSVSNLGTEPATSVVVDDPLPAGVTFVSASGTGWTCTNPAGRVNCTRPSLALTGSTPSTITINVTAPVASGTISNTATVSSAMPDVNLANNTATELTTVLQGIDVAVTKTAQSGLRYPGQSFTYTLNVQNISAKPATNLTVKDVLPSSLTFVSASGTGWNCVYSSADRTVTCHNPSMAAGATSAITLTVTPSGAAGAIIANTATISSPDFVDEIPGNNTSTTSITLSATADLAISKVSSTSGSGGGQVDTFTVTLTNNGPGTATGIVVKDAMSGNDIAKYTAGCTVTPSTGSISPSPSPWNLTTVQAGGTWSIASLANGASATLGFSCPGFNRKGVTNVASVTSTSRDPNLANNQASAFVVDSGSTVTTLDMTIAKTAPASVFVNGTLTYTITVTNLSAITGTGTFTVTDTLPAGTTYQSFTTGTFGGSCSHTAGVVTCTSAASTSIASGASRTFTITVTAPPTGGSIINTAVLRFALVNDTYDPTNNNTATATTQVNYLSTDIAVTKTVSNALPPLNSNVTFTITASNTGSTATNLRLMDLLPTGFTYVSSTPAQGSYDRATGLWYIGSLANGASTTLTITAKVVAGAIANTACLYALDQTDTNSANNCATATTTPQYADLALTKTVSTPTPNVNADVVFTVTLKNNGPSPASAIQVQDLLPDGLQFVSAAPSTGTYTAATGVWAIPGPVVSGASVTLMLTAKATVPELLLTNTASITASNLPDTDPSNNSASASVTGRQADIQVTKTVDNPEPTVLNTALTFTVKVWNSGPSTASGVAVTDLLPAGLVYQSHTASQGTYVPGTGIWTIGSLAPYVENTTSPLATLTLVAKNTAVGSLTNTATKTALDQFDPDLTNDTASASVLSGGAANLEVTKSVDKPNTSQGDSVNFTVYLRNLGTSPATGVKVTDLLPAGLAYQNHSTSVGTYDYTTGIWTVGNVAVLTDTHILTVTALANSAGTLENSASVTAMNQADPDLTNNTATASVRAQPAVDLSVTKAGPSSAALGSPVSYTIVAANNGPSSATGAIIADSVPAQITGVTWTCVATGSADCDTVAGGTGASGSGNAITLNSVQINAGAGNYLTITVNGTASVAGTFTNTVIISPPAAGTIFDTSTSNNSASVTTVVSSLLLSGRVFADTGTAGAIPNNGVQEGGEIGIVGVTVRLTNCGATIYSSSTTAGDGRYNLAIPNSLSPGATLCVVETNLAGYVSTGGQAGNSGGAYDRPSDAVQFTLAANMSYANINFGDVPGSRFLTDNSRTALPGSTVSYQHIFIAGTGGTVSFATMAAASPSVAGWAEVLYLDANCDGVLSTSADSLLTGAQTVVEGQRLCIIQQQFVPAALGVGASNLVTVLANFVYTNAAPALTSSYTRQDLTTTSDVALQLFKEVRNVTQNASLWALNNQARTGDELEYRITYTNNGVTPIINLVVRDMTPAYTVFISGACGLPLPPSLTSCTVISPAALSTNSSIQWQFNGSLASSVSGTVTYKVKVQ